MRHRQPFGCVLVVLLSAATAATARGDEPAPAPAPARAAATKPAPATKPADRVAGTRRLIAQLAADDFEARDAARVALMGMGRAEIAVIRDAVKQSVPLGPSQMVVLREVVMHVYLSGDDFEATDDGSGFLGVSLPSDYNPEDQDLADMPRGVAIISRVPGFCAYRMLQNGDVILSMRAAAVDGAGVPFTSSAQFIATVRTVLAGERVTFEVLRQGRVVSVPVTLDRRPEILNPQRRANQFQNDSLLQFNNRRAEQADELWEKDFAPLLGEQLG